MGHARQRAKCPVRAARSAGPCARGGKAARQRLYVSSECGRFGGWQSHTRTDRARARCRGGRYEQQSRKGSNSRRHGGCRAEGAGVGHLSVRSDGRVQFLRMALKRMAPLLCKICVRLYLSSMTSSSLVRETPQAHSSRAPPARWSPHDTRASRQPAPATMDAATSAEPFEARMPTISGENIAAAAARKSAAGSPPPGMPSLSAASR